MTKYIIMCEVSGGVTGYRVAPMKENGKVIEWTDYEAAVKMAETQNRTMNNLYSTANFRYWVEEKKLTADEKANLDYEEFQKRKP